MLHITRTFIDAHGQSYQKEEFIRQNDAVLEAYVKIRQNKSEDFM